MRLLFEDDLVEGVVQWCATGRRSAVPALQLRRFNAERERCYQVLDPDERATAFARVHSSWFHEWGFEQSLASAVGRFPGLERTLVAMAFRKARGKADEGAELYGDAQGQRRGIVALRPDRISDDAAFVRWLHHELAHLADMVDQQFGYSPDLPLSLPVSPPSPSALGRQPMTESQQRLLRARYRVLWNVSIDGRLTRRGLETVADAAHRRQEFDRGFAFLPEARRVELFTGLWSGRLSGHAALLELAADPRGLQNHHAPIPGAPCPLCGFAAFQWTDANQLRPAARERIRTEFPGWRDGEVICARCAEMYDAITGQEYPATVCL